MLGFRWCSGLGWTKFEFIRIFELNSGWIRQIRIFKNWLFIDHSICELSYSKSSGESRRIFRGNEIFRQIQSQSNLEVIFHIHVYHYITTLQELHHFQISARAGGWESDPISDWEIGKKKTHFTFCSFASFSSSYCYSHCFSHAPSYVYQTWIHTGRPCSALQRLHRICSCLVIPLTACKHSGRMKRTWKWCRIAEDSDSLCSQHSLHFVAFCCRTSSYCPHSPLPSSFPSEIRDQRGMVFSRCFWPLCRFVPICTW